ncbi:phage holin family protein [Pontibacter sp. SGAir0037]|uniref:phage holin family protein n=1 Tax=Pontibacter sp. SGAir0037 TaxID=2571030 RepID=UPI0010CCE699|nr:phage holin family protein [Pontibacter sp. SGAir0037]QCR23073.1 hypothetical protein C1N53_12445 [Pontibacter sp. SGAir0037]
MKVFNIILLLIAAKYTDALQFVNKYIFADWDFIPYLVVIITIDTFTGVYANWKLGKLHSFKMRSLFEKIQMYAVGLIIIHGIASHLVDGSPNKLVLLVAPYLKNSMYLFMLACEALSVEENLNKIGKSYLPKWIRKKLLDYKETGVVPKPEEENQPVIQ